MESAEQGPTPARPRFDVPAAATRPADACETERLADLMSLACVKVEHAAPADRATWSTTELAAIWRHQLSASLLVDLGGVNDKAGATLAVHSGSGQKLETFADS